MAYKFWTKKWERKPCNFVLEEYGAAGKPGWAAVSDPTGEAPKREECTEFFKPGCHYRVMAKSIETGKFVGTVWKYYDPLPGGIERKAVVKKQPSQPKQPSGPRTASEWMGQYASEVADTLGPLVELLTALKGLEILGGGGGGGGGGQGGQPGNPQWPALEFSGQAPWMLHPWIVREVGNQIKDVGDHIIDKLSSLPAEMAKKAEDSTADETVPEGEEEGEAEMPLLPSAEEYVEETSETTVPEETLEQEETPLEQPETLTEKQRRKKDE